MKIITFAMLIKTKKYSMAFDIEMIKKVYQKYPEAVEVARNVSGKALT
jgi:hypothetical protein